MDFGFPCEAPAQVPQHSRRSCIVVKKFHPSPGGSASWRAWSLGNSHGLGTSEVGTDEATKRSPTAAHSSASRTKRGPDGTGLSVFSNDGIRTRDDRRGRGLPLGPWARTNATAPRRSTGSGPTSPAIRSQNSTWQARPTVPVCLAVVGPPPDRGTASAKAGQLQPGPVLD